MRDQTITMIAILILMNIARSVQDHFCESFKANNYTIDYSITYLGKDTKSKVHYLVIDHRYWRLTTQIMKGEYGLIIDPQVNGVSQWFGKQYETGFSIWSDKKKRFIYGMVRKGSDPIKIDWGIFESSTLETVNRSLDFSWIKGDITRPFPSMFSMQLGRYSLSFAERKKSRKVLLIKSPIVINLIGDRLQTGALNLSNTDNYTFGQTVEMIAVFEDSFWKSSNDLVYFFYVYAFNKSIKYCVVSDRTDQDCSSLSSVVQLKTLIDCHATQHETWFLIALIILIVILIICGLCFCYHRIIRRTTKWSLKSSKDTISKDSNAISMVSSVTTKGSDKQ